MAGQLKYVINGGDELAFSPPVLLELLRGPQGAQVAELRAKLAADIPVLPVSEETFKLAGDAMERLAGHSSEGHRIPISDLVTAVIADEHGAGVLHCDDDFERLSKHAGLGFPERRLEFDHSGSSNNPAARQRELRKELNQALHQLPLGEAEALLEQWVAQVRSTSSS